MSGITVRRDHQERIIMSIAISMRLVHSSRNIRTREDREADQGDGAEAEAEAVEIITMMKQRELRSEENTREYNETFELLGGGCAKSMDATCAMIDELQIIMDKI